MATTTVDGPLELTSEVVPPRPPEPILLKTRRDATLLMRAVENRVTDLKKLAKDSTKEGYHLEARVMSGDAAALEWEVLPQLREQGELALVSVDTLRSAIERELRDHVEKARKTKMPTEQFLSELGRRIERYARAVADAAYEAGYAARVHTSEHLAFRATRQLNANPDEAE